MTEFISTVISFKHLSKDVLLKSVYIPIVIGAITSVWTMIISISPLLRHDYEIIITGIKYTYLIVVIAVTVGYIYGHKLQRKYLLLPWLQFKLFECILLNISHIWIFLNFRRLKILSPVAIFVFVITVYLIYLAWGTFKAMPEWRNDVESNDRGTRKEEEKPPGYDDAVIENI